MIRHTVRNLLLLLALALAACSGGAPPQVADDPQPQAAYILGPGDKLAIHFYGIDDINGGAAGATAASPAAGREDYTVSETGLVGVPLVGEMHAAGLTLAEFKQEVTTRLSQGIIKSPRVGVEIVAYRPFYIFGEVNRPGAYPYAANLTVLSAVATAGGYTHRADEDFVIIERNVDGTTRRSKAGPAATIRPDDIVRIPERFF